jgi:hypothetical protein
MKAGIPGMVNPLLSCGIIIVLFLTASRLFDYRAGIIAAVTAVLSPSFLVMGASYFSHTAEIFFSVLFCYCIIRIMEQTGVKLHPAFPIIAAFAIIMLLLTRPGSGAAVVLGTAIPLLYHFIKTKNKNMIPSMLIVFSGVIAGAALLLIINKAQTGDYFLFAFNKYCTTELLGFRNGHTPLNGIWNFICLSMKDCFWICPLILTGVFTTVFIKKRIYGVLVFPAILYAALYFLFPAQGQVEFGSRYYLAPILLLIPLAAGGIVSLSDIIEKRFQGKAIGIIPVFFLMCCILVSGSVYPILINSTRQDYISTKELFNRFADPVPGNGKYITFIRTAPNDHSFVYTNNYPDFGNNKNIPVLFLSPEENQDLLKLYPDRTPLVVNYNRLSRNFNIEPYNTEMTASASDYIAAARNYKVCVSDPDKTESLLYMALSLETDNPEARYYLGYVLFEKKEYQKALDNFKRTIQTHPDALYYAAKCYGEMGEMSEAARLMKEYIEKYPSREKTPAARDRLKFYSERE